jgi:hypothetical protein
MSNKLKASSTNSRTPIAKFKPANLNFKEQSIGSPKFETVFIENSDSDELVLDSISGNAINFYCSFFLNKIIPPGGQTSFQVYFLARQIGEVSSALFINTNKGIIKYDLFGIGVENKYGLNSIINGRIPVNSSFTTFIKLYNPHSTTLKVTEISTSDDDLHLELPLKHQTYLRNKFSSSCQATKTNEIDNKSGLQYYISYFDINQYNNNDCSSHSNNNNNNNKIPATPFLTSKSPTPLSSPQKNEEPKISLTRDTVDENDESIWTLKPYETKTISILRYIGRNPNNYTSFVSIKTLLSNDSKNNNNLSSSLFIIPVEVEVRSDAGIYASSNLIDFGLTTISKEKNQSDSNYKASISLRQSIKNKNRQYKKYDDDDDDAAAVNYNKKDYYSPLSTWPTINHNEIKTVDLYLTSSSSNYLSITNITTLGDNNPAIEIVKFNKTGNQVIPPTVAQLTKIAEIKFNPLMVKNKNNTFGQIKIETNDTSITPLTINFEAKLIINSLDFTSQQTIFFINNSSTLSQQTKNKNKQKSVVGKNVYMMNKFEFPLVIHNVSLNSYAQKYFNIIDFKTPIILKISQSDKIFKALFNRKRFIEDLNKNDDDDDDDDDSDDISTCLDDYQETKAFCLIHTNFTDFMVPLYVNDGALKFTVFESIYDLDNDDRFDHSIIPKHTEKPLDGFLLDEFQLNSAKEVIFIISNPNSIPIGFDSIQVVNLLKSETNEKLFNTTLSINFMFMEPLGNNLFRNRIKFDKKITNDQIKELVLPGQYKMVLSLKVVIHFVDKAALKNIKKLPAYFSFRYKLALTTDNGHEYSLPIKFHVTESEVRILYKNVLHQMPDDQQISDNDEDFDSESVVSLNKIAFLDISSFPSKILTKKIYLNNSFPVDMRCYSIESTNYGNALDFQWELIDNIDKGGYYNKTELFGLLPAQQVSPVGRLIFDISKICEPKCYLGLSPHRDKYSFQNEFSNLTDRSVHRLWLETLSLEPIIIKDNTITNPIDSDVFALDTKLVSILRQRFEQFTKNSHVYKSVIRFNLKELEQKNVRKFTILDDDNDENIINYSMQATFTNLKWPHLINFENNTIVFPLSPVYFTTKSQNLTINNPSSSSLFVQLTLLDNYPNKIELLKFILKEPSAFIHKNNEESIKIVKVS